MTLLIYYTTILLALTAGSVVIGLGVEKVMPTVSMPIFLCLFFLSLWVAWIISVKLSEPKTKSAPIDGATSDQRA
jgi:hypothetical protein